MGCWNETCMVSNLPILGGEECAIAILLEQGTPYLGITPIDKYMPLAIIHGEYNEYGHLENIDETEESALLSALPALALKQTEIWNYVDCSVSSLTDLLDKMNYSTRKDESCRLHPLGWSFQDANLAWEFMAHSQAPYPRGITFKLL